MQRQRRKLTMEDRVAIDLRRKDGWGVRAIARELGRSPQGLRMKTASKKRQHIVIVPGSFLTTSPHADAC